MLHVLGFVDLLVTLVGVLGIVALRARSGGPPDAAFVIGLVVLFIAGVTLGGLLIGLGALVRYGHARTLNARPPDDTNQVVNYYTDGEGSIEPHGTGDARPGGIGRDDIKCILARLTEIRDLTVTGRDEGGEPFERLRANLQRVAAEEIIEAINTRRLGKARELLRDAEAVFGQTPTLERLHTKIDEAAVRNEPLDYAFTKRVVEESIRGGRWDLAEQCVHALFFDHPASIRCRRLWDDTRRVRLYDHIQACVADHRWAEAVAAAEEFLERFSGLSEAGLLRGQMETLRANAEIVQRKQYETKFKELVSRHEYRDALRIAKHVVSRFPESPQAEAFRDQIPLLEMRATG